LARGIAGAGLVDQLAHDTIALCDRLLNATEVSGGREVG
jgi:hypothetical protein